MIPDIIRHLASENIDLKLQCSSAIFKCASDKVARDIVRQSQGFEPLVGIIKDKNLRENKKLLAAASGALWKCAGSSENVKVMDEVSNYILILIPITN